MKEAGFIKIPRSLFDVQNLHKNKKYTDFEAQLDLFYLANYKAGTIKLRNDEQVTINRGECGWSQESLAQRWKWSRDKVRRFLIHLNNSKIIQLKKGSKHNVIVLLGYDTS